MPNYSKAIVKLTCCLIYITEDHVWYPLRTTLADLRTYLDEGTIFTDLLDSCLKWFSGHYCMTWFPLSFHFEVPASSFVFM